MGFVLHLESNDMGNVVKRNAEFKRSTSFPLFCFQLYYVLINELMVVKININKRCVCV